MSANQHPTAPVRSAAERPPLPTVSSSVLMAGSRELIIQHGDDQYRLRLTSKGKLILVK